MTTTTVGADEQAAYWAAVTTGDHWAAYGVAAASLARGVTVAEVLDELVVATQRRVGDLWACNELTVAQEHAATAVGETVVERLGEDVDVPTDGAAVLVACAEREWHSLPALVVTTTLRSWGVRADYLGPNARREQLVSRILDTGPRAVLLSASLTSSLARVRRQVEAVRGTGTPAVVGGSAFGGVPERALRLGATAYAADPLEALALLDTLPHSVAMAPRLRGAAPQEARAVQAISDDVARDLAGPVLGLEEVDTPDDWRTVLTTFVPHVVDCVVGALLVDDPRIVADERAWLARVVERRHGDAAAVDAFWGALADRLREFPEATRMLATA
jgi:methanogenic corrinoid protein MtbC1